MKKTISMTTLTLTTANAFALFGPGPAPVSQTYCIDKTKWAQNNQTIEMSNCDQTANNISTGKALKQNNCAEGQVAFTMIGQNRVIPSCEAGANYLQQSGAKQVYCIDQKYYRVADGSLVGDACDESRNNQNAGHAHMLGEDGCTADQAALKIAGTTKVISSCMPPGVVQL